MITIHRFFYDVGVCCGTWSHNEEGSLAIVFFEDVHCFLGVGSVWAIIKCEGDEFLVSRDVECCVGIVFIGVHIITDIRK